MGISLLFRIIIAHLLADFFLQPHKWVEGRKQYGIRSRYLYYHVAVVGLLTYILILDWSAWELALFITVTHFFIDWWKSNREDTIHAFLIDQTGHLLILLIGWSAYTGIVVSGLWDRMYLLLNQPDVWIILAGYIIILRPMGFLIEKWTTRWRIELIEEGKEVSGLSGAGTWIGYIERVIILTFILLNQYGAIGFLIAAKSIFRFSGEVKDHRERKYAEYILIGTLISFSLAILLGIGILALL